MRGRRREPRRGVLRHPIVRVDVVRRRAELVLDSGSTLDLPPFADTRANAWRNFMDDSRIRTAVRAWMEDRYPPPRRRTATSHVGHMGGDGHVSVVLRDLHGSDGSRNRGMSLHAATCRPSTRTSARGIRTVSPGWTGCSTTPRPLDRGHRWLGGHSVTDMSGCSTMGFGLRSHGHRRLARSDNVRDMPTIV